MMAIAFCRKRTFHIKQLKLTSAPAKARWSQNGRQERRFTARINRTRGYASAPMVKEIKPMDGSDHAHRRAASSMAVETEGCWVFTSNGKRCAAAIDRRGLGARLRREGQRDKTQRGSHGNPPRCTHII